MFVTRFKKSVIGALLSQLWRTVLSAITMVILRHLITPEEYGLWDWLLAVFLILAGLRDLGMHIHTLRLASRPYKTLLLHVFLSGGLIVLLGVFLGDKLLEIMLYQFSDLVYWSFIVMLLAFFLDGLAIVGVTYAEGKLMIDKVAIGEVLRNTVFSLLAIYLAWLGFGIWSLVGSYILGTFVFVVFLARKFGRGIIDTPFYHSGYIGMLKGALPIGFVWFTALLVKYVDHIILGNLVGVKEASFYYFAYFLAFLIADTLHAPFSRTLYPAITSDLSERDKMKLIINMTLAYYTLVLPAAFFLSINAESVVYIVGGEKWREAAYYLKILAFVPIIDPLGRFAVDKLLTDKKEKWWIGANLTTFVSFTFFGYLFISFIGVVGMAYANYLPLGIFVIILPFLKYYKDFLKELTYRVLKVVVVAFVIFFPLYFIDNYLFRISLSSIVVALYILVSFKMGYFNMLNKVSVAH